MNALRVFALCYLTTFNTSSGVFDRRPTFNFNFEDIRDAVDAFLDNLRNLTATTATIPAESCSAKTNRITEDVKNIKKNFIQLAENVASIKQIFEDSSTSVLSDLQLGYKDLGDGWFTSFNGYQYKITPSGQNWNDSRTICQGFGADLAVVGIMDVASRRVLLRNLPESGFAYWIGLRQEVIDGERKYVWLNNVQASTNDRSLWAFEDPEGNIPFFDCGGLSLNDESMKVESLHCLNPFRGLCEKRI